jgi:peptidoglycan hydrolase CwlO-like protein
MATTKTKIPTKNEINEKVDHILNGFIDLNKIFKWFIHYKKEEEYNNITVDDIFGNDLSSLTQIDPHYLERYLDKKDYEIECLKKRITNLENTIDELTKTISNIINTIPNEENIPTHLKHQIKCNKM